MIETSPDNAPETGRVSEADAGENESGKNHAVDAPNEGATGPEPAGEASAHNAVQHAVDDAEPTNMVEDGVALHIVEPRSPGTIMVAVAEPTDACGNQFSPVAGEASEAEAIGPSAPEPEAAAPTADVLPLYDALVEVAAVRLGGLGPALFFTANGVACAPGDKVIVSMEEGQAFGEIASLMRVNPEHLEGATGDDGKIRPVVRAATEKDLLAAENNRILGVEALGYCRECIRNRDLDMKLVDVLILHDRSKMVFYFTAPARIDFRELVKDLVRRYRTRIELRQIGVRHETQMVGALGNCGMVCCCRRYLRTFAPVAIKMAKEQNVFLNPVKISGICGRLLCCLAYEQEHYDEFYRSCPKLGKKYHTDAGIVRVLRASLFRESVTVLTDTGEEVEYSLADWNGLNPFRPNVQQQPQPSRKQDPQGGEGRQRKSGTVRGSRPPVRDDGQRDEKNDPGPSASGNEAVSAISEERAGTSLLIAVEEGARTTEGPDGLMVEESRVAVAAIVDDAFDASDDADDDREDNGGSIFGLAPGRSGIPGGGSRNAKSAQQDGARRRRPRRRKPQMES